MLPRNGLESAAMQPSRHARRFVRARLVPLMAGGVIVGALAGLQVGGMIDRAGAGGLFGAAPPTRVEPIGEKPREEDREVGAALAAATHADDPADCRAFERRHRDGCLDFVRDGQADADLFDPPAAGTTNTASDWPAAFD